MPNDLTSPLAAIIAQAAKLPATTGETARHQAEDDRRATRLVGAGTDALILADVSSSMDERAGSRRRIDILRDAVDTVLPQTPNGRLIAFHSIPSEVTLLPEPQGGTALHLALQYAASLRPRRTLVISDGEPDDEAAALAQAEKLTGTIDVIYVGDDSNHKAIAFMRKLARAGCGRVIVKDLRRGSPALEMRQMLALPAPGGNNA
jgi:hypothetical protein